MVQATQVRLRFAAANASFRAIGEGRLAAAAEDELRADARAAVDAILATVRPGGGQAPRPADEAATIERIAELATALPSRPPQPRTPAGQLATGDIIGHPGYRFQPFRLSAPPRHTEAGIEITGRLADPSNGEPTGQITLRLTRAGRPEPVVCLIPPPARPLRSLPGRSAATQGHHGPDDIRDDDNRPGVTAQPSAGHGQAPATAQRPHDSPAGTAAAGSTVMTPGTATPGPSGGNGSSQPPGTAPPPIQKDTMPPAPSATSPPQAETEPAARAAPAARPAPAARKPVAQPAPASQSRPGSQAADDAQLLHELDHVLAAITERRRAAAAPPGTDGASFADIRAAFTVLRRALDLPGPGDNGNGARPSATVSGAAHPTSTPIRAAHDGAAAAPGEFSDIRAAFASLRDVLGLPAPSGQDRPSAPGPDGATRPDTGRLLDQAAAEAHTCARWYRDTPEWQRMSRIGRAARELLTAIRETAADYWAEIRHDIRVRGFARTLAVRVSLTVSGTARLLTGRLERAGHRGTRPWRAAWRLHQATAAFAGRIMNDTPPGAPARMDEARRIINDLGRGTHRPAGPEPSRAAGPPGRDTRTPGAVALSREGFPVLVARANTRPDAEPAARPPRAAPPAPGACRDPAMIPRSQPGPPAASAPFGGCTLTAAGLGRAIAGSALDQARHGPTAFGVQPQEGAELRGGDPGVPDQREQLDLLPPQPELLLVVIIEERAAGTPKVLASASITRSCGLVSLPVRSFQMVVVEICSPVAAWILKQTSASDNRPRPAGWALSRTRLTLSARVCSGSLPAPEGTPSSVMLASPRRGLAGTQRDWLSLSRTGRH